MIFFIVLVVAQILINIIFIILLSGIVREIDTLNLFMDDTMYMHKKEFMKIIADRKKEEKK